MHVYVHVPFCARRCSYCDFSIAVRRIVPDAAFVAAIATEWRNVPVPDGSAGIATLYFGGGTPSRLAPAALAELIGVITDRTPLVGDAELTIEVNPDDVTPPAVAGWAGAGVNRVSLGVQSHDPSVLQWMHRTHRAEQVAPAVAMLRDGGISNISMDLIFAVPAHLERDWRRDVEQTLALSPEHVSLYGLTIESHTPLARWAERGDVRPAADDAYAREYLDVHAALVAGGFDHYEVSNAARPGRHSRHNAAYWSGADYVGLGPSAHSLQGRIRSWNIRDWEAYRGAVEAGEPAVAGSEALDARAVRLERRYLGLRTSGGLEAAHIPETTVGSWLAAGWARRAGDRIVLTAEGWLRLDALVAGIADS